MVSVYRSNSVLWPLRNFALVFVCIIELTWHSLNFLVEILSSANQHASGTIQVVILQCVHLLIYTVPSY